MWQACMSLDATLLVGSDNSSRHGGARAMGPTTDGNDDGHLIARMTPGPGQRQSEHHQAHG